MNRNWVKTENAISFIFRGKVFFSDSIDHFENAVLRLLGVSEVDFMKFVERVSERTHESPESDVLRVLQESWKVGRTTEKEVLTALVPPSWLMHLPSHCEWVTSQVRDNTDFGIAISPIHRHGWLSNTSDGQPAQEEDVEYEEEYFEGRLSQVGYGSYLEQSAWRLEKASRQCSEISALRAFAGFPSDNLRILDIGSGYGFFRHACQSKGWTSDGIEISCHAARVSKELFGLDTFIGTLDDFSNQTQIKYDVIVMWDFIEHVDHPQGAIETARTLLSTNGSLFIRTPNLEAFEFQVFGQDYHSLKREHLNLFSPYSLAKLVSKCELSPQIALTSSHLLKGFVNVDTSSISSCLMGSDILLYAQHP